MLETKIPYANAKTVNEILLEHRIHNRFTYDKNTAILKLRAHHCDWQCLVRTSDAGEEAEEDEHDSAQVSRGKFSQLRNIFITKYDTKCMQNR